MADPFFSALDRWMKTNNVPELTQGTIVSITGALALVKIRGSSKSQEAWYSKGANLGVGDNCIMIRPDGNTARWVIVSGYSTILGGESGTLDELIDLVETDPVAPTIPDLATVIMPVRGGFDIPQPSDHNSGGDTDIPFNRGSGTLGRTFPPDLDQTISDLDGIPGHSRFAILFSNSSAVAAGFTSLLYNTYTFTAKGSGKISNGSTGYDFTTGEHGWEPIVAGGGFGAQAVYHAGEGYSRSPTVTGVLRITLHAPATITSLGLTFNFPQDGALNIYLEGFGGYPTPQAAFTGLTGSTWSVDGFSVASGISLEIGANFPFSLPSTLRLASVTLGQASGVPLYGDTFFQWELDGSGKPINIAYRAGLKIDGVAPTPPAEINPDHIYTFDLPGTGNPFSCVYYDTTYTDNQDAVLTLDIVGTGAA